MVKMQLKEYQRKAHLTAQYPKSIYLLNDIGQESYEIYWTYPALGLSGEVGELMNKLKKIIRDQNGIIDIPNSPARDLISQELGDILWYIAELATVLDLSLDNIAVYNLNKLENRAKSDKIKGSGDNR